jgi:hypothetical protein
LPALALTAYESSSFQASAIRTHRIKLQAGEQIISIETYETGSAVQAGWPTFLNAAELAQIPSATIRGRPKNSGCPAIFG